MTVREKKLALFLGVAAFVLVNLALYFRVYEPLKSSARRDIANHQLTLKNADFFLEMREQYADEIKWLEENVPKAAPSQEVEASLQRFAQTEASRNGLAIERHIQRRAGLLLLIDLTELPRDQELLVRQPVHRLVLRHWHHSPEPTGHPLRQQRCHGARHLPRRIQLLRVTV